MSKVAILVPTMNRLDFVIRLINYYVSINCSHPIFIGDASAQSSEELVLKAAQDKIDIYYFHWEKLNDRKTMVKLAEEAHLVGLSNYCAFTGDDDFFIPDSLSKCAKFLDENPEYATSQGRAFSFQLDKVGAYGEFEKIGNYWNSEKSCSLKGVTALERLQEITSYYWVINFSVHRTTDFIADIGNGADTIIDRFLGEHINVLTSAMRGKSKFIDCLYLARNSHSGNAHETKTEWIRGENWHSSYNELISAVAKVLSSTDNLSLAESNRHTKLAVNELLKATPYKNLTAWTTVIVLTREKVLAYIDKTGLHILSKYFRRIKYISISIWFLFISKTKLPKSSYYKDASFIVNSCRKSKNSN